MFNVKSSHSTAFPLTCVVVLKTLWHYRARVLTNIKLLRLPGLK